MEIDRRQFLTITTAACALTALKGVAAADDAVAPATNAVPAAPATNPVTADATTAPATNSAPATNAAPATPTTAPSMPADTSAGSRVIDAGPADNFANDGVYSDFRLQGFFLVRKDGNLVALSSVCTHHKQPLAGRPDCTLYCKKHGSIFGPDGHVEKGPAKRDLPVLATSIDSATGHLLVTLPVA